MSGGFFDYKQYNINSIKEDIEDIIEKNNKLVLKEDRRDKWDDRIVYYEFSDEVIAEFKNAVEALRVAQIYAQRIDWLISDDDSEETFFERLKEDLNKQK
jgi:hypothetical protein